MAAKKSAPAAKKPVKGKVTKAPAQKSVPKVAAKSKAPAALVKAAKPVAPVKVVARDTGKDAVVTPAARPEKKKGFVGDFIGTFPLRKNSGDKKLDNKKQPVGPVFPRGDYQIGIRETALSDIFVQEFEAAYLGKHLDDKLKFSKYKTAVEKDPTALTRPTKPYSIYSKEMLDALIAKEVDVVLINMKDVPLDLPNGLLLAAALRREDPRDALITRSTYGAVQELPSNAKVGAASKRRIMQVRNLRPDIEIVPLLGDIQERMDQLEALGLDAVFCAWATLRRLNISPRFYVALQPEQMIPAACQGGIGIVCREEDKDLIAKLRYIEDSEASWSARCERAFVAKLGSTRDLPVGVFAHRKGTQDPWILDAVVGDPNSGEVLRHREIGTSRCKPESLADKAFMGILAKGARKFLPFG